jgi:hypothetical protein
VTTVRDVFESQNITILGNSLIGPWRSPRQLLSFQRVHHAPSIHGDEAAAELGFRRGLIEGPTHFSQFAPLLHKAWGNEWFEKGIVSARYKAPVYDGDEVQATLTLWPGATSADLSLHNREGIELLRGTASIDHASISSRLTDEYKRTPASGARSGPYIGMTSPRRRVELSFEDYLGELYPFTLRQKLSAITEPSPWYTENQGKESPWGRPIVPLEMISVMLRYNSGNFPFPVDYPLVQMFGEQKIFLKSGPLFVNEPYEIQHRVVASKHSRRFDSVWIVTDVFSLKTHFIVAQMALNMISFGQVREVSNVT